MFVNSLEADKKAVVGNVRLEIETGQTATVNLAALDHRLEGGLNGRLFLSFFLRRKLAVRKFCF